jgi:hypothetical protein
MANTIKRGCFAIAIAGLLLTGCSTPTSVPLSAENVRAVKTVKLDPSVSKPKTIYWRGTAQAWGAALFGAIGGAATANAGDSDAERMVALMEKERIDVSQMVYSEVVKQIGSQKSFQISESVQADAVLSFSVTMYGFNKTHPFGSNMNPLITIMGKLTKPNNEVIWQESEFVSDFASDNDQGQSIETYQKEPVKLRAALAKATEVAVKRVVAKLP